MSRGPGGKPAIVLATLKLPGANVIDTGGQIKAALPQLHRTRSELWQPLMPLVAETFISLMVRGWLLDLVVRSFFGRSQG